VATGLVAGACANSTANTSTATTTTPARGPVDVLYAGSLVDLMLNQVGPGFQAATGDTLEGTSGDSGSLANEIKGKVLAGDVFISASPTKNALLEGAANGGFVTWYASFAQSSLVIGYNPKGRFAAQLRSQPWYDVVDQSGFLLGRTDPATDPKGQLAVKALDAAAGSHSRPALAGLATSPGNVYAENTLVGRLQAGQLDAGFFYAVEANGAGIPTVSLPGSTLAAHYTITILSNAAHRPEAKAFVEYLLARQGVAELTGAGLSIPRPLSLTGTPPPDLVNVLR
jgi:molybdate/tungstate transport system substrate-binding protein